jgi:methylenetetrahydrofolate--tRNA-(uracil-5-)-methyltransferase
MQTKVTIIGAGLAGSEAAHQLSMLATQNKLDISIDLYEMRPVVKTPAHHTSNFAELVCSNSLGSELLTTARGLLIAEMEILDSLIIRSAKASKVPAGQALAVDREVFAEIITDKINNLSNVNIIREELTKIPEDGIVIIATGPLTSEALAEQISQLLNDKKDFLKFFDAASPIISAETINMDIAFKASRYDKGEDDYINCPFYEQEDFEAFYQALVTAEQAPQKDFEKKAKFFESCLPIEEIARRGKQTLCFGPLKPVGLRDQRNPDRRPLAVVQLRQDNGAASLYNIVGFQTNLKWGEQKRVFSMIPGLENAEIVRYGVMHQNIYIHSPSLLTTSLSLKNNSRIYFAGQITGVEGYTESAATGIIVARDIIAKLKQEEAFRLPAETMLGALINYVSSEEIAQSGQDFQPMNSNWGLINFGLDPKLARNKKLRNETLVARSLQTMHNIILSEAKDLSTAV